ncbi:hypothetical protein GJ744_005898 [Endocarpon pusillum]|uniref:Tryptophan synthase beta chain-like PALP domain-containing protein n=1 Tax=Endocarpon pusillum TaxID=364733 RepID=A0A8H7AKL3_9EURO|nr:hypothetical protein GJ744_005898 [Endocarpon pusillum]
MVLTPAGTSKLPVWTNPSASSFQCTLIDDPDLPHRFHAHLPGFQVSPLVPLDDLAAELGIKRVFVKDESKRAGLPAFKILGASWGTFRAVAELVGMEPDVGLEDVVIKAQEAEIKLLAATEGNHGQAVARMAKLMKLEVEIYASNFMDQSTESLIAGEGAKVIRVDGDYDAAVAQAAKQAFRKKNHILIQDNSFEGYEKIPNWIIEGYSTLLMEVESQLQEVGLKATTIVTPIGVGSLGHAVVSFAKSKSRGIGVIGVEPINSACLHHSLRTGNNRTIRTTATIMAGMNCGTVSPISWPILKQGVNASVTISEWEAHQAVEYLHRHGIDAGPCGAAALAALRRVAAENPGAVGLGRDSVVVLLSTEGKREYAVPNDDT